MYTNNIIKSTTADGKEVYTSQASNKFWKTVVSLNKKKEKSKVT